ncbi:MAG: hypothetical protein PVH79_00470 [Candidatus Bathyarchaeota archaeon]
MGESRLHAFLKKVGVAFLLNQRCFLVDTEVPLSRFGQRRIHELDAHHIIDVCGVGERFVKPRGLTVEKINPKRHEVRQNILRGVEVKVSRGDIRNGFFCTGCNHNYLLTPMRLVNPASLPRGVGLIEYNKYKFKVELREDGSFAFKGLRVVKKSNYKRISRYQVDNATAYIAQKRFKTESGRLIGELSDGQAKNGYSHT